MSDIPDEIARMSRAVAAKLLDRGIGDEDVFSQVIARALMAATKRERERCARIADQWATDEQRQHGNGGPAAAILKGEAS